MNADKTFHLPRADLAKRLAQEMLGHADFQSLAPLPISGTFLSAPRRVGKSTFLQNDLIPELKNAGVEVVYVDLWTDDESEPAQVLKTALDNALGQKDRMVTKAAKAIGLTKISAMSALTIDIDKAKTNKPSKTITDKLKTLVEKSKIGKLALIVDEAQQAMGTEAGEAAMFALKAARDALNANPKKPQLMLLCTGSSRSKLSALVRGKQSPFYGAAITDFPVLGKNFSDAYTAHFNQRLSADLQIQPDVMFEAFQIVGHRPENLFLAATQAFARHVNNDLNAGLIDYAKAEKNAFIREMQALFVSLSTIQQAVLVTMLELGEDFSPFGKQSLASYAAYAGDAVSATSAQSALDALVQKDIVWRSKRGVYELDDLQWVEWWNERPSK